MPLFFGGFLLLIFVNHDSTPRGIRANIQLKGDTVEYSNVGITTVLVVLLLFTAVAAACGGASLMRQNSHCPPDIFVDNLDTKFLGQQLIAFL